MTTQDSRPQAPASNEAAERLRAEFRLGEDEPAERTLDDALAAERRATVERIREQAMEHKGYLMIRPAILDEEAAR